MLAFMLLLGSALVSVTMTTPIADCPHQIGASGVRVRLPPALSLNPSLSWAAPPTGWYFKPWNMINASNAQYLAFRNLQYDPTTVDKTHPGGQVNDLTSFQAPGNDTIYTSYGVDIPDPRSGFTAVLQYAGTGVLTGATGEYSLMAWGCDALKQPYYASYSTETEFSNTPAGIDIMSTCDKGPDSATVNALITAMKALPNPKIKAFATALTKMTQDGGRNGYPRMVSAFGNSIVFLLADAVDPDAGYV